LLKPICGFESVYSESLFKTSSEDLDFLYKKQKKEELIRDFYARAFFVVHYLFADIERMEKLRRYLYLLNKGLSVDESFKDAFNMTFSELDYEVYTYFKRKQVKYMVYSPGENGLDFPNVEIQKHDMKKRDVLRVLYTTLSSFSDELIGDGNFDKFTHDIEKLYPGLVAEIF
jgi:hypothetical protein